MEQNEQVCWTSLQSDQILRGPHVLLQQQLSVDICCPRPTSAANPPAAPLLSIYETKLTERRSDGRTLHRFMTIIAYCADCVITAVGYKYEIQNGESSEIYVTTEKKNILCAK